jgi:arylsulfatase A-like enzyme
MTGMLPHNHGVLWVTHNVDPDQGAIRATPQWAQVLKDSGYHTGYFGKWHVEHSEQPSRFGWNEDYSLHSHAYEQAAGERGVGNQFAGTLVRSGYVESPRGYNRRLLYGTSSKEPEKRHLGLITDLALRRIGAWAERKQPWCCFVSTPEPHDPFVCSESTLKRRQNQQVPLSPTLSDDLEGRPGLYRKARRAFGDLSEEQHREAALCYHASIEELDAQFGRLLDLLREIGEYDNTIVVITTDHGELLGAHGYYCKNICASEEVYNIPLLISGPGVISQGAVGARVGLHDLSQTILDLCGLQSLPTSDSRSFAPLLRGELGDEAFTVGYAEYFGGRILLTQRVLWDGEWKFVFNGFDEDELYNLQEDPYETRNLIRDSRHLARAEAMMRGIWRRMAETGDNSLLHSDYFPLRVGLVGPDNSSSDPMRSW